MAGMMTNMALHRARPLVASFLVFLALIETLHPRRGQRALADENTQGSSHASVVPRMIARFGRPLDVHSAGEGSAFAGFSPDGKLVAYGGAHGKIWIWNSTTGKEHRTYELGPDSATVSGAFSPDGKSVAIADQDGTFNIWELPTSNAHCWLGPEKKDRRGAGERRLAAVAFSPDGKYAAADGVTGDKLILRDICRGVDVARWTRPQCLMHSIAFSPDSKTLAVATRPPAVEMLDIPSGRRLRDPYKVSAGEVACVAFSPDGAVVAVLAMVDGHWFSPPSTLYLFDARSGMKLGKVSLNDQAWRLAFAPDGRSIATGGGRQILIWEVSTLRMRTRLPEARTPADESVGPPSFSREGTVLAVAYLDATVRLWDITGLATSSSR